MTGDSTILVDAFDIEPGDSFRFNGEWLDVFIVRIVTVNNQQTQIRLITDDDREFIAMRGAQRRVRRP